MFGVAPGQYMPVWPAYQRGVPLTLDQCASLRRLAPSVAITPASGLPGTYDLTPGSWIGGIYIDGLAIQIRPKVPLERVLFLLSYALDPRRWLQTGFDFEQEHALVEAVIPAFVTHLRRALGLGLLQGYRVEEAALMTVRGRLRVDEQVRRHFGVVPPVEVRYDEYSENIEENKLLKAAIARLGRLSIRSKEARRLLRIFDAVLHRVESVEYDPQRLPPIHYTRLNQHYKPAVELAKLILRSITFEVRHGGVRASAFLVDMNEVFEDFMVVALREALKLSARTFPQGARGRAVWLDEARRVRLHPDVSWWSGENCVFVGDIKYRRLSVAGMEHADLYQLLSYAVATGLEGGLLIYAAGEAERRVHRVVRLEKELHVMAINLAGSPMDILGEVSRVAHLISRLRVQASVA